MKDFEKTGNNFNLDHLDVDDDLDLEDFGDISLKKLWEAPMPVFLLSKGNG